MMACMAGFGLNDAMIKSVANDLSLFQAIFLRSIFATVLIGVVVYRSQDRLTKPSRSDTRLLTIRMVGEIGGTISFLTAVFHMPLANATAILQAMPLAVTLGAAWFLGESVGWRRYLAIIVGFVGVLIIVRPGTADFDRYSLWAMAACFFFVLRDLSTRRLSPAMSSSVVTLITAITITVTSALLSLANPWHPVSTMSISILLACALCVLVGYIFGVLAMRTGDVGAVSPFRYSILLWAIALGIVLFDEWPDTPTLIGASILVLAGVYTIRREALLRKSA